jgi:hypothetical protein
MTQKYLEAFAKKIDKRQADQVLAFLNKKKQEGQIRTVDEFIERLDSLVRELVETELSPTLKVFDAHQEQTIDSETFNHMLDRITDDFRSSFEEANNIFEVQTSHRAIIRDVVLKTVYRAINQLETKLGLYETKKQQGGNVSKTISRTFNATESKTTRSGVIQPGAIFSDPRTGKIIKDDAYVEEIGDRLTLAKSLNNQYEFKKVYQVFDVSFPRSELVVEPPGTSLKYVIDNTANTYWAQSLLFETVQPYTKIKIVLEFSIPKDLNYIEIEPITDKGFIFESFDYENDLLGITNVSSEDIDVSSSLRLNFQRISASRLFLTFRNENFVPVDFQYSPEDISLFQQAVSQPIERFSVDINGLSEVFGDKIQSPTVKDILGVIPNDKFIFSGYAYSFGFDNIRAGLSTYSSDSIYVSAPLRIKQPLGQLYLNSNETRPVADSITETPSNTVVTYDGNDSDFYFSSLEYWVIKRDYDKDKNILRTSKFPLIPRGNNRINHERLLLTSKYNVSSHINDVGQTVLFTDRIVGNVKVYRNGLLSAYGIDWEDITSDSEKTPNSGVPMVFKIRLNNPVIGDIYTVSYTPMYSNSRGVPKILSAFTGSGIDVVDMKGNLSVRYVDNNTILLNERSIYKNIEQSDIFLCVILRNNSSRNVLSAVVEQFDLFIGTRDISHGLDF